MNELQVHGNFKLEEFTKDDVKKYLCEKATDTELSLALNIIKSYGLNPFKREIYITKFGTSPANIIVGYMVYIKRAENSGKLDGWRAETTADGAMCTIHRKDWSEPFVWEILKSEFDKKQSTWNTMPDFMLKKVCIAQAFRLAFPGELGGLPYTQEETDVINADARPVNNAKPALQPPQRKPENNSATATAKMGGKATRLSEALKSKYSGDAVLMKEKLKALTEYPDKDTGEIHEGRESFAGMSEKMAEVAYRKLMKETKSPDIDTNVQDFIDSIEVFKEILGPERYDKIVAGFPALTKIDEQDGKTLLGTLNSEADKHTETE
ncbi:MAG: RecT family recombinase [Candidatus Anammoxibacter sp.]